MKSMTGFGRAEIRRKKYFLQVELSSVNSRYLETIFRMPRQLACFENNIKEIITSGLSRGKVTVTVNVEETPEAAVEAMVNLDAAEAVLKQLKRLRKRLNLKGEIEISHILANYPLTAPTERNLDVGKVWPDLKKVVGQALADLIRMRQAEGRNLKKDMLKRLKTSAGLVGYIEKQAPLNVEAYRERLAKRISELGNGLELESQRLAEEVTIYADRSDVTEECIRLHSHLKMFKQTLNGNNEAGKRLNFILQEMGREANTISSKALSNETAAHAIALKEEVEKLREQVQNIE